MTKGYMWCVFYAAAELPMAMGLTKNDAGFLMSLLQKRYRDDFPNILNPELFSIKKVSIDKILQWKKVYKI